MISNNTDGFCRLAMPVFVCLWVSYSIYKQVNHFVGRNSNSNLNRRGFVTCQFGIHISRLSKKCFRIFFIFFFTGFLIWSTCEPNRLKRSGIHAKFC